jgi:hypothetical protein
MGWAGDVSSLLSGSKSGAVGWMSSVTSFGVVSMKSSTLRHLWTVVEEAQTSILLKLSDTELVRRLLGQLETQYYLSPEEAEAISDYILARATLIRDVAQSRRAG